MIVIANLDLQITLRCNASCRNCIKFCNKESITGLDYSDSDMTLGQIDEVVRQIKSLQNTTMINCIVVTGGEPLLHPQIVEIMQKLEELRTSGHVKVLWINSNLIIPAPPVLQQYIVNWSEPKDNDKKHHVSFLHPADFSTHHEKQTYQGCCHYRKPTLVLNYLGCSMCCAGDAYIRLFGLEDLLLDHIAEDETEYTKNMDMICQHCPYGRDDELPLERDVGCPVSEIYLQEAAKNKNGRRITKRFPSLGE